MKSKNLQELVLLKTRNGLSSLQIKKDLCDLVSRRTIQRCQAMYRQTEKIQLKKPPGAVRTVRTKKIIQKVKNRYQRNPRQSVSRMSRRLNISRRSLERIVKEDLHLHPYRITNQPKLTDDQKKMSNYICILGSSNTT